MPKVSTRITISEAITAACKINSPSVFAISRITAPMAPGPAINGVAMGNTEISRLPSASCSSSSVVEVLPDERAKTMSMPISSSNMPPPVRRAAIEMPSANRSDSPMSANVIKMPVAISAPRTAMRRRCFGASSAVRAAKTAATSRGPMVAKNVASPTVKVSRINPSIMLCLQPVGVTWNAPL